MQVALRHPNTGNFKFIDTGWSWPLFLGAGCFGVPLFFRGLALWGTVMLVLWFLQLAVPFVAVANGDTLEWILSFAVAGVCLFLGFRGNALSARHFVACGYDFAYPDSVEARAAAENWGL
jgi:hypothetical protein